MNEYQIALEQFLKWSSESMTGASEGWAYDSYAQLLLDRGRWFEPRGRPRPPGVRKGENKQCYRNAFWVALEHPGMTYVEGFAIADIGVGIPMDHAWCIDEGGRVVETTWAKAGKAYRGIPFTNEEVQRSVMETSMYGVLGSDYLRKFKLLRTGEV